MSPLVLMPALPLLGFLVNGVVGHRLHARAAGAIGVAAAAGAFAAALAAVHSLLLLPVGEEVRVLEASLGEWIGAGSFSTSLGFSLDPLSAVMVLVVTGVGFLIHVYSLGYMRGDGAEWRYFAYLNLFLVAMLVLVLGSNLLLLFLGWEGVGLCSYLLIGFWYTKEAPPNAGLKAFLVNRVGDLGFLIGLLLLARTFGTLDLGAILERAPQELAPGGALVTAIALLLFLGAAGKSAQIPLHVWLPDAMEGPTPVSALIHAATMVTAGVYLVARTHVLYLLAPTALAVVAVIGLATALMAATIALTQNDIKRVLAYSTISQLGYMFLGCGVGAFSAAIFHLMTHAFFKALLFLGAGSVIHALGGEQDLRKMGGLARRLPVTHATFLAGSLALAGVFPLAGFFSKDEILAEAWVARGPLVWALGLAGAALTAFYMFRLMALAFYGKSRLESDVHPHEAPLSMGGVLVVLALLSVAGGWVGVTLVEGGDRFGAFLAPVFADRERIALTETHGHPAPGLELALAAVSLAVALAGLLLGLRAYLWRPEVAARLRARLAGLHTLFSRKYYFDEFYGWAIVRPVFRLADLAFGLVDVGVIDRAVNGTGETVRAAAERLRLLQSGYVRRYALVFALGVAIILGLAGR
jgi:NADH-quinone oxidoreductase subunit L